MIITCLWRLWRLLNAPIYSWLSKNTLLLCHPPWRQKCMYVVIKPFLFLSDSFIFISHHVNRYSGTMWYQHKLEGWFVDHRNNVPDELFQIKHPYPLPFFNYIVYDMIRRVFEYILELPFSLRLRRKLRVLFLNNGSLCRGISFHSNHFFILIRMSLYSK